MSGCGPGSMLADVFNDEVMCFCARGENYEALNKILHDMSHVETQVCHIHTDF